MGESTAVRSRALAFGKAIYDWLPLSQSRKRRLAELAFTVAGPVFDREVSYHLWRRARKRPSPRLETAELIAADALAEETAKLRFAQSGQPSLTILITSFGN